MSSSQIISFAYLLKKGLAKDPGHKIDVAKFAAQQGIDIRTAYRRLKEARGALRWLKAQGMSLQLITHKPAGRPVSTKGSSDAEPKPKEKRVAGHSE